MNQAEILEYAKSIGVPVVDVQPACYMENWLTMLAPRKASRRKTPHSTPRSPTNPFNPLPHSSSQQEDGSFVFALPVPATSTFSLIDCGRDYGAYVRGAIETDAAVGSEILACADEIDIQTVVDTWAQGESCESA